MTRIQLRRDTATNWESVNPVLAEGEIGIDLTNNKFKIGNGVDNYADLPYASGDAETLTAQSPLEIEDNYSAEIITSSNITYDVSTGSLTTNFSSANEEGTITFTIPSNVNIDVLNDYWRIGTKTQDLQCLYYDRGQNNGAVFTAIDEDDNTICRVWYGAGSYRKGDTASGASYFHYSDKDIMHHIANEQATYQGTGNDNFSSGYTLQSKRLKAFTLYYVSVQSYTNLGSGITNYNDYQHLSDIRLFTSADDTEGILLEPTVDGKSIKLNIGSGLDIQDGDLVNLSYTKAEVDELLDDKQDILSAGDGISISNGLSVLPNDFTGSSPLITCDGVESGYEAYKAFDGNPSTYWGGDDYNEHWIMRQHASIIVKSVSMSFREANERFTQGEIQGSNDGTTFTTLASFNNNNNTSITVDCSANTTAYTYTRIVGTPASGWGKVGEIVISYKGTAVIAVDSTVLQNTSTAENTLTIDTTTNPNKWAVNIGRYSQAYIGSVAIGSATSSSNACKATGDGAVAVGFQAQATATTSTAIGVDTKATALGAIQIGKGTNSTANTLYIGFNNSGVTANYQLLDGTTGLIPIERIPQGIQTISTTTGTITLVDRISLYKLTPSAATTLTFIDTTTSYVDKAYTFELCIDMSSAAYAITFPSSVTWQGGTTPNLSNAGIYFFTFRTIDGGTTWLGSLQGSW